MAAPTNNKMKKYFKSQLIVAPIMWIGGTLGDQYPHYQGPIALVLVWVFSMAVFYAFLP